MRTALVAIALIALVPLAGCLGSGGPSDAPDQPAADDGNATDGSGSGDDGTEAEGNATGNETTHVDGIDWSASTNTNARLGASVGGTIYSGGVRGQAVRDVDLGSASSGNVTLTGSVNVTWQPDSAVTETLQIRLVVCDGDCTTYRTLTSASGTSTLSVSFAGFEVASDRTVQLHVEPVDQAPGPAYVVISTDQSFTATGQIVVGDA